MKVSSTVLKTSTPGDRRTEFIALVSAKQYKARSPMGNAGLVLFVCTSSRRFCEQP